MFLSSAIGTGRVIWYNQLRHRQNSMTTKVRKAVIPVAGYGTRFLPATKAQPKEMLPVVDKPGVQYAVEEAVAAGITDIIFVTGASKRAIEDHFDANPELESRLREHHQAALLRSIGKIHRLANFIYVRQQAPLGNGHAILMAQPAIGNEPFAVIWPDDFLLTQENPIRSMVRVFEEYQAPVVGVLRVPKRDVNKYGIIKNKHIARRVHEVLDVVEKPSPRTAPSRLASLKGFVFPPEIFRYLKKLKPGKGGERWLIDAVREYNRHRSVFACEFRGDVLDLGSKLGWLKANVMMGLRHPDLRINFRRFLTQELQRA